VDIPAKSIFKTLRNYWVLHTANSSAAVLLFAAAGPAQNCDYLSELDLEDLLNIEVISASKREQRITDSPNAIFVITAEDIKRSGAVFVPDLFRMVPGVDVVHSYGNTYGVSARGFNDRLHAGCLWWLTVKTYTTSFRAASSDHCSQTRISRGN